jgi:transcriptional regulator with XRE-family HTH domain
MATASSPTVWRRWLALELRRLREERGLSQKDAGKACGWSGARLSYMENAQQNVTEEDLDRLLGAYQVPDDRWSDYFEAVTQSHRRGWWERYERVIPDWFPLFVGLEQGASQIRYYELTFIPGLLQTPRYAEFVLRNDGWRRTPQAIKQQVELRVARQGALLREENALELVVVLDEAALRRLPGDEEVAREQIDHLCEMVQKPNVAVHVLPFSVGVHSYSATPFILLSFPFRSDEGIVYLEHREGALYLEEVQEVESFRLAFEDLVRMSLPSEDAVDVIRTVAEASKS